MKLTIHVQPNAKQNQIIQWLDDTNVKIKIAAPAQQGRANRALVDFLSNQLKTPKSNIQINWGFTGRVKQVEIDMIKSDIYKKLGN
jgi:uncharacterized protein